VGHYIRSLFENQYRVVNRYSAEAALKDIETVGPDLVISDVVMGKMSGFDLCHNLKSDVAYSHIPIILLTAKTDVEDSVSGLESGANAYVTKPFSAEYLTALVSSLLRNMENVRSYLNAHTDASLEEGALGEQDSRFMSELYNLMEKHLSEADLNVPSVCAELRISRSKFNYKLKGLTGSSPGAFFRNYKLNRAAKLLKEGKYNVSEIADMMGFASVSNFSASFKKMFGVAPRDYGAR
jgi:DNA-binding response OmpR family regulator